MTMEERVLIEPSDIVGIEYACSNCHTRYLTPIKEFKDVAYQCQNCKEGVVSPKHLDSAKRSDANAIHNFIEALRDLQERSIGLKLEVVSGS